MNENLATKQALQAGAHPLVLTLAKQMLGKKAYIGWCQSFVQKVGGNTSGASAIAAWQNAPTKIQGMQGIQPGDLVYFSPNSSNQGYGHTGVYAGNNQFISATNSGILQNDLGGWSKQTGQRLLGYVPQGERQSQPQPQAQVSQPQVQQSSPILNYPSLDIPETPVQQVTLPKIQQPPQENTTTYGRITVPNI